MEAGVYNVWLKVLSQMLEVVVKRDRGGVGERDKT